MAGHTEEAVLGRRAAELDREELCRLGEMLEQEIPNFGGGTMAVFLAGALLRIRDRSGVLRPLLPNRVQCEFERQRARRNIVLKARQLGVSTWVSARFFLRTITRPGTLTIEVAHTQEAAEGLFRIVHRFYEHLPRSLRMGALKRSRSSARQIAFPALDSEYRVESAADENAGRGSSIQNLHCSEVARWPGGAAETLAGLRAALSPDGELVLESTPNGADGCFYQEWRRAEETGTARHFFPWWYEDAYVAAAVRASSLTAQERELGKAHGLTLEQIGYRRQIQSAMLGLARQEFAEDAETCFLTSGCCIFDLPTLDRRWRETRTPPRTERGGELLVWFDPVPERQYVVAVDPAGGGSEGDFSVIQVVDVLQGWQCAEFRGRPGTLELAEVAAELARRYNRALLAVERNNHGSGVLAYLHSTCQYDWLYSQDGQDGWLTNTVSRPAMLGRLGAALVDWPQLFQSRRLLAECRTFVRHANGRTGAKAGNHDDCVMAMAIGLAVRAEVLERESRRRAWRG